MLRSALVRFCERAARVAAQVEVRSRATAMAMRRICRPFFVEAANVSVIEALAT